MTTTAISHSHETPSSFFSSKPRVIQRGVSVAKGNTGDSSKENTFQTKAVTKNAYLLPKPIISTNNATGFSKAGRNTPKSFIISKKSDVKLRTDGLTAANKLDPIKPKYSTQAISTEISKGDVKKLSFRGGLSLERTNLRQRAASNADPGIKASSSSRRVSNGSKLIPVTQIAKTTSLMKQAEAIKFGREALKPLENNETRTNDSPASDNGSFQANCNSTKNNGGGAAALDKDEVRQGSSSSQIFRIKSNKSRDLIRVNQVNSHSKTSEKDSANSPLNKFSTPGTLNNLDVKKEESNKSNSPVLGSSSADPKAAEPAQLSLTKITSSSSSQNSNVPRGLVGLRNIGNTCFMNSILQCLFNTPGLSDYFLQGTHKKEKNSRNKGLADAFAELLGKIKSHTGAPSYSAESTHDVKNRISRINPMFSGYSQHDAQEFLKAILEGINDDVNRVVIKPPYKELTADPKRKIQDISDEWYNYMLARDNSIITDLFCGQLMSKITCTHCNNESLAFDNFWDLALSFTKSSSNKTHLSEMLAQFLKEEALEDLFHCENCKVRRKSKKRFVIWRLPKVLVVQLKRFEYTQYRRDKINKTVTFPVSNFDLSKFTQESTDASVRDCKYTLIGTVNHGGSLSGGHYTAECMNTNNRKWYNFNDSSVRETSMNKEESESSSPYILFYVKSSCLNE